jgi:hypothetical protein
VANLGDRAVAVVRHRIDHHGDASGAVALVSDLVVGDALLLAGAAPDGALDGLVGHVRAFGVGDGLAQARVGVGVAAARAGRDLDLLDELREELAALGVERALLVFNGVPLGVS